jgi:hypothetical protein
MRVFLTVILPLLAPSLLYLGWLFLWRKPPPAPDDPAAADTGLKARLAGADVPWVTLVLSGAVLAVAATMATYLLQPMGQPGSTYVPPRLENGRLVPSEMRPADPDAAPGSAPGGGAVVE